ncbi:MAG: hypothetical protein IJ151_04705 [Bacteroidales bacterium]|nr:hypothetical protein [Bacteroidales bacterium]
MLFGPNALRTGGANNLCGSILLKLNKADDALARYLQAADVYKNFRTEYRTLKSIYSDIADCYHQLDDHENEEKFHLLASATKPME